MGLGIVAVVVALGIGVAVGPQAPAFIIRMLGSADGVGKSWACAAGSLALEALVAVVALALVRSFGGLRINPAHVTQGADTVALLEGLLGIALVIQAVFALVRGTEGTNVLVEKALSDIDAMPASTAFVVGISLVSWTLPAVAGAAASQSHGPMSVLLSLALLLVFLAVAMCTRVAPILVQSWAPRTARSRLARARAWIERFGGPVSATVTLVLGLAFTALSVAALLRQ